MCRSENEPNGPYRCSADMHNVLLASQAYYADSIDEERELKSTLENLSSRIDHFKQVVDSRGDEAPEAWIKSIEVMEQRENELEGLLNKAQMSSAIWRQKMKQAQLNYDSTRGGIQDLAHDYNELLRDYNKEKEELEERIKAEELEDSEAEKAKPSDEDELDEETLDRLKQEAEDARKQKEAQMARIEAKLAKLKELKLRMKTAINTLAVERKRPLEEEALRHGAAGGIVTEVLPGYEEPEELRHYMSDEEEDDTEITQTIPRVEDEDNPMPKSNKGPEEDKPSDEGEVLSTQESQEADELFKHKDLDLALDHIIDDLELSGVDKKYQRIIDPNTGEEFDEHEISLVSRRQRREARMRLKRMRQADNDSREMMKSFLRSAIYRSLRYNKMTRKIVRLIGVKHYNDFLERWDDIRAERGEKKFERAKAKWEKNREAEADRDYERIDALMEKERAKYQRKLDKVEAHYEEGKLTETERDHFKKAYNSALAQSLDQHEVAKAEIDLVRSAWAEEAAQKARDRERTIEQIQQAMIERKRFKEQYEETLTATRI